MSDECGSPSGHWHEEVRLWSDAATTCRSSLAWCAWARQVQTAWWCADARTALLYSIWQHTGHQSLRLRHDCLHLAASHQVTVLPHRRVTYGGQAFAVAGLSMWNSLPKHLRDHSKSASVFDHLLKTFFSQSTNVYSASEALARMQYINWHFTLHYCVLHT